MRFFGSKDIKVHLKRILLARDKPQARAKALDIPCGNGVSLETLRDIGYAAEGADLFPELNRTQDFVVHQADLSKPLPFSDEELELVLCQEGIEHIGNQNEVFTEFSRILKQDGTLIVTTPNYSNIKSRLSYLLTESEAFGRIMPANEEDSIWLSSQQGTQVYFGHVFLTGITRLRLFALLAGLEIKTLHSTRINYTSLLFFPILYPLIVFFSYKTYRRFVRKTKQREIGKEVLKYMIMPKVLLQGHLVLEFVKRRSPKQALQERLRKHDFSMTT